MTTQETAAPTTPRIEREAGWTRRHLLDVDDLARDEIDLLMETTDAMKEVLSRDVPRVPALRGRTIVTLFYEASTRTRASFELAGKALGADVINVAAGGSSVEKGESLIDTVRTLQAVGADALVMRHGSSGAPYLVARNVQAAVINAGDGWHAHPTQALLDLYTMRAHLGDLRGRKVVIVGDIAHSRVARSNIWALAAVGANVTLCAPTTLLPASLKPRLTTTHVAEAFQPRANHLPQHQPSDKENPLALPPVTVETNLDLALPGANVVMALRLQTERMSGGLLPSLREYAALYQLTEKRLALAAKGALVMHPGPINEGVEIAPSVASSLQSVIEEQVTNGVAVRMAVLYLICRGRS
jgi:aspartate carbamoyltransferase catalytic subunit